MSRPGPGPGLQPERTALAWQRTGLSVAVVTVLLVRNGFVHGAPLDLVAAGFLVAALILIALATRVARGVPRWLLLATTGTVVLAGLLVTGQLLSRWG